MRTVQIQCGIWRINVKEPTVGDIERLIEIECADMSLRDSVLARYLSICYPKSRWDQVKLGLFVIRHSWAGRLLIIETLQGLTGYEMSEPKRRVKQRKQPAWKALKGYRESIYYCANALGKSATEIRAMPCSNFAPLIESINDTVESDRQFNASIHGAKLRK